MTARLVLVESNTSGTGRLFAAAARELGLEPVLLAADPARYPYAADDRVAVCRVDTSRAGAVVDAVRELGRTAELAGVTTSSDYYVVTAARAAAALGLPGGDPDALATCRDKGAQRRALARAGIAQPVFVEAEDADAARAAARRLGGSVVVKPAEGSGSVGVRLCEGPDAAATHAARLLAVEANERGLPVPRRVLVEEAVVGAEVSVEIVVGRVIGVTGKHLGAPPTFVEIGHDAPAAVAPAHAQAAIATARAAVAALGLAGATTHVELKLVHGRPIVVEVNPRLAGGFIPELWRLARGVDLVAAVVAAAAGRSPALEPTRDRAAAIRFLVPRHEGRWVGADGVAAARARSGVHEVATYREAGAPIAIRGDFRDRVGHVIAVGPDPAGAAEAAAAGHEAIDLVVAEIERGAVA